MVDPVLVPLWPDACHALGVGRSTGFTLAATGELETVMIGRRRLVPVAALHEFAAKLRNRPGAA